MNAISGSLTFYRKVPFKVATPLEAASKKSNSFITSAWIGCNQVNSEITALPISNHRKYSTSSGLATTPSACGIWISTRKIDYINGRKAEPRAKPIYRCGQAFANKRGLRHHLYDTYKLNKAIWLNLKLPRKRKRTYKAEAQVSSMESEEQPPKKLRFYRYLPPRHELKYQLLENVFMPIPTLHSFVEEH
ncbi:hypothetical protein N7471_011189 [Penicillium samsonianum]|uniref:uncharacterized protein n=1 Tax=Penicillium samsonianum TaxID=1882272 RepID=UPI0025497F66|nr:uncharacterized protein N7471_011189 [Penicillium samsonianum]KAJ6123872.1 hypothetical protein N7471_011189 [Penicillium samsonianum]